MVAPDIADGAVMFTQDQSTSSSSVPATVVITGPFSRMIPLLPMTPMAMAMPIQLMAGRDVTVTAGLSDPWAMMLQFWVQFMMLIMMRR